MCSSLHQCLLFHSHILFTFCFFLFLRISISVTSKTHTHTRANKLCAVTGINIHFHSLILTSSHSAFLLSFVVVVLSFWVWFLSFFFFILTFNWCEYRRWIEVTRMNVYVYRYWAPYSFSTTYRPDSQDDSNRYTIQFTILERKVKKKEKSEYKTMAFSICEIYIECAVNSMCVAVDLYNPRLHSIFGWHKESREENVKKQRTKRKSVFSLSPY